MEDKQKILDALLQTLRLTRSLYDLEELTYEPSSETVFAKYESGYGRRINVAMDSGTAMIKDVMSVLC
jgi:hypothetical protein